VLKDKLSINNSKPEQIVVDGRKVNDVFDEIKDEEKIEA